MPYRGQRDDVHDCAKERCPCLDATARCAFWSFDWIQSSEMIGTWCGLVTTVSKVWYFVIIRRIEEYAHTRCMVARWKDAALLGAAI